MSFGVIRGNGRGEQKIIEGGGWGWCDWSVWGRWVGGGVRVGGFKQRGFIQRGFIQRVFIQGGIVVVVRVSLIHMWGCGGEIAKIKKKQSKRLEKHIIDRG